MRGFLLGAAVAALGALAGRQAAIAQTTESDGPALQEIIVTAQRRPENVNSVPIVVTVLTGQDLILREWTRPSDSNGPPPGWSSAIRTASLLQQFGDISRVAFYNDPRLFGLSDQPLNDGENHRCRYTEQQHADHDRGTRRQGNKHQKRACATHRRQRHSQASAGARSSTAG